MTGQQRRFLRGLGHSLKSIVLLGKEGITANVLKQITDNLRAHELIKVKLPKVYGTERKELGAELAESASATLVQVMGRQVLLYKRHPNKPKIKLPKVKKEES